MTYQPSELEENAAEWEREALTFVECAIRSLVCAEKAILDEERKHAPYVGIGNQHRLCTYPEIRSSLSGIRKDIVQRLTGEPAATAA